MAAVTAALNTAPLLCTKVKVFKGVAWPTLPTTLTAPELPAFKVNDSVLAVLPLTVPPKVTWPPALALPPVLLSVRSAVSVSAVLASPKLMAAFVVATVPAALMAAGAVAVSPPAKVKLSPAPLPSTKLPVFMNVVAVLTSLTCVVVPNNSK